MNIFLLDKNLKKNAEYYCDKHIVKMILETVQILCAVSHLQGIEAPYKLTHKNHPCVKWVMESGFHWDILIDLVEALNTEYKYRYNHGNHKSYDIMKKLIKPNFKNNIPTGKFVAVVDNIKICNYDNVIKEYRKYYKSKNSEINMKWTKRNIPDFLL